MFRKRLVLVLSALVLLIIFSTGCNSPFGSQGEKINLKLAYFPDRFDTYNVKIYAEEEGEKGVTNVYEFNMISYDQILNETLWVDPAATCIMVYLFDPRDEEYFPYEPEYFSRIELADVRDKYEALYWIDYDRYESYGVVEYGYTEQLVQTVETTSVDEIDFTEQPYVIYKLANVLHKDIDIKMDISSGEIGIDYYGELSSMYRYPPDNSYENYYENYLYDYYSNNVYLRIQAMDHTKNAKAVVNITIN